MYLFAAGRFKRIEGLNEKTYWKMYFEKKLGAGKRWHHERGCGNQALVEKESVGKSWESVENVWMDRSEEHGAEL